MRRPLYHESSRIPCFWVFSLRDGSVTLTDMATATESRVDNTGSLQLSNLD